MVNLTRKNDDPSKDLVLHNSYRRSCNRSDCLETRHSRSENCCTQIPRICCIR